jgi:uncharacterized protein (DUF1684 family)
MKALYPIVLILLFTGCNGKKVNEKASVDPVAYQSEIDVWHKKRVTELKGPKGWLNIAGLFWLKDGINTFGSDPGNDIVFPEGTIPPRAGFFMLKQNTVTMEPAKDVAIMSNGQAIKKLVAYNPDSARNVPFMGYGNLEWFIIKRDDKFGVRLRNFKSPELENFTTIERFPVDVAWRIEANFEKADSLKTIDITNVLGQTTPQPSPGTVVFDIDGKTYRLDALDEGGEEYFIIVGDDTNTRTTYGAGRYLYVARPDSAGKTVIDFNKAYNPPCAFTAFATCPLPPKQNILPVAITAGEKNYGTHH